MVKKYSLIVLLQQRFQAMLTVSMGYWAKISQIDTAYERGLKSGWSMSFDVKYTIRANHIVKTDVNSHTIRREASENLHD